MTFLREHDDDLRAEARAAEAAKRRFCPECRRTGYHAAGCPESPQELDYDDMTDDEKLLHLVDDCDATDVATRLIAADARISSLESRLRKAEKNAARWLEVSRHGPACVQIYDARLGVMFREGADADHHVDVAIQERKFREAEQAALRG